MKLRLPFQNRVPKPTAVFTRHFSFQEERPDPPAHAESTQLDKFVSRSLIPSKFIPGLTVDGPPVFSCPQCNGTGPEPEHGDRFSCSCGLIMETYGNALYIWQADPPVLPPSSGSVTATKH